MTDDQVALYLADCIAATAHDFDKKSAAKGERERHRRLCETAADLILNKCSVPRPIRDAKTVAERLETMASNLRKYETF